MHRSRHIPSVESGVEYWIFHQHNKSKRSTNYFDLISFELKRLNSLNAKFDCNFFQLKIKRNQRFKIRWKFQNFEYDMMQTLMKNYFWWEKNCKKHNLYQLEGKSTDFPSCWACSSIWHEKIFFLSTVTFSRIFWAFFFLFMY